MKDVSSNNISLPPLLVLALLVGVIIVGTFMTPPVKIETKPTISVSLETVSDTQLVLIGDNSLVGLASPPSDDEVLASLGDFSERRIIRRIIFCESSNNPNAKNPHSSAKGLLQVIDMSARFCEKAFGRKLDMYNPADNLACGEYLYEHGGLQHWKASENCWSR